MKQNKTLEEITNETHIKWLSKAETAIIKGSEMTVLPYGYLSQAVSEAISQTKQELIEEIYTSGMIADGMYDPRRVVAYVDYLHRKLLKDLNK